MDTTSMNVLMSHFVFSQEASVLRIGVGLSLVVRCDAKVPWKRGRVELLEVDGRRAGEALLDARGELMEVLLVEVGCGDRVGGDSSEEKSTVVECGLVRASCCGATVAGLLVDVGSSLMFGSDAPLIIPDICTLNSRPLNSGEVVLNSDEAGPCSKTGHGKNYMLSIRTLTVVVGLRL